MARSESTVRVDVKPSKAFQMWADVLHLSDFLTSVSAVEPTGDGSFLVTLKVGEVEETSKIELTTIEKPRRLVWRSSEGARWNGELIFRPTLGGCEIRFIVDYEPAAPRKEESGPNSYNVPTWNVGDDLLAFRNYAERQKPVHG